MLTRNYIRRVALLAVMLSLVSAGFAQVFQGLNGSQSNSILDISDLRPSNPDQFIKHIFVRDSTYTYAAIPGLEDEWLLESRATNTYDSQERLVGQVMSDFNGVSWDFKERFINAYNADNQLLVQQKLLWSNTDMVWLNNERKTFDYNSMGLESHTIVQNWFAGQWKPSESILKTYDLNGLVNGTVQYLWHDEKVDWIAHKRTTYSYNVEMLLEEVIVQFWVDSTASWINATRHTFEYNDDNNLILSTLATWNPLEDNFVDNSFQTLVYNDRGQISSTKQVSLLGPAEQDLFQESANYDAEGNLNQVLEVLWDEDSQEWENFKRHTHYWSKRYTGNLDTRPDKIMCRFENPHTVGQPWFCESLKHDVVYSFEVYDLLGRLHYSAEFEGQDGFRIERSIPPGVYLAVIRGGLDVHTEKVVLR